MRTILYLLLATFCIYSCKEQQSETATTSQLPQDTQTLPEMNDSSAPAANVIAPDLADTMINASIKMITNPDGTFGYAIDIDGMKINQPNVPGLAGNKGFATTAQAKLVAKAVLYKLEKGISPPTIEKDELQRLGVDVNR
jgi:hypothetical protein